MKKCIWQMLSFMGGGDGGRGKGSGGGGGGKKCEEPHEDCPMESQDSLCKLHEGHRGDHVCESCGEKFES
ncbi:MAG: hypothetical protein ACQ9MH_25870 [Nitrospinales bacterium]